MSGAQSRPTEEHQVTEVTTIQPMRRVTCPACQAEQPAFYAQIDAFRVASEYTYRTFRCWDLDCGHEWTDFAIEGGE